MPQLTDFGTSPGQITRAFTNFEIMALSGELGVSRGLSLTPANIVNTAQQSSDVSTLLNATIKSRNDLDELQNSNGTITAGTIGGVSFPFNINSVAQMDRVLGVLLIELAPALTNGAVSAASARQALQGSLSRAPQTRSYRGTPERGILSVRYPRTLTADEIQKALSAISSGFGIPAAALGLGLAANTTVHPVGDKIVAIMQGLSAISSLVAVGTGPTPLGVYSELFSLGCASGATLISGYLAYTDDQGAASAAASGDTALAKQLSASYANELTATEFGALGAVLGGFTAGGAAGIGGSEITSIPALHNLLIADGTQNVLHLGNLLASAGGFFYGTNLAAEDAQTAAQGAAEIGNSASPLFAELTGSTNITNSQGQYGPLPMVGLQTSSTMIADGTADLSGNYVLDVPLGASVPYNTLTLVDFDPLTNTAIASSPVDLSSLAPGQKMTLPTVTGACNDPDAYSGDGDDPDCD